jgi:DNA repair protein RadD
MQLRPYQEEIVLKARSLMQQGVKSMLIQSPTGSGKTLLTAHMLGTAARKQMASWFIVHRRELVKQSIKAFGEVGVNHGVISANFFEDLRHPIQIASIQTLARRYHKLTPPKLVIWDECHHIAAGTWAKIRASLPNAFHIGLTATPQRLDGAGLRDFFSEIIHGPSVEWLIENGYLAPYRIFAPGGVSMAGVHTRMGDFVRSEMQTAIDKPTITGDAIKHYRKLSEGKRAVVFCVSIEHSKHVVQQFLAEGINAAHVDGETDPIERDNTLRRFERGEIKILSNVELFGEGFDLPSLETLICLRPTQSLSLWLQMCGRVLRPSPGKTEAIILDHAGNCERHGFPDQEREWSLDGRGERSKGAGDGISVRVCPRCFAAQFSGIPVCKHCGFRFELKPRQVDEVDGELIEVDPALIKAQRRREQGTAQTEDDLVKIGIERGYKRPRLWARHVWMGRKRK